MILFLNLKLLEIIATLVLTYCMLNGSSTEQAWNSLPVSRKYLHRMYRNLKRSDVSIASISMSFCVDVS